VISKIQDGVGGHFEKSKNHKISDMDGPISTKFGIQTSSANQILCF